MTEHEEPPSSEPEQEAGATPTDERIRERVREITSRMLRGEHIDPHGVEDIVRSMAGSGSPPAAETAPESRQALLDSLEALDAELLRATEEARGALAQLGAKGPDFTDNDLKELHAKLSALRGAYVETVNQVAMATSGNLRREFSRLAGHAQRVGLDAGVRTASMTAEVANRLADASQKSALAGMDMAREQGARVSLLASGFLAGIADALGEQRRTEPGDE